ncbi:MAG: DUF3078 domain-containing protein [Bacteroidota bacterium]
MKPKVLLSLLLAFVTATIFAQSDSTSNWTRSGSAALNFSNVGLSNWAGGGESTIAIGTVVNLNADRETEKSTWTNNFKLQFGMARVGESGTNLFKKTDDLVTLSTNYGYKISEKWSFSAIGEFRTQLANGNTYFRDPVTNEEEVAQVISQFMAPGYFQTSLGFQYKNKFLTASFSPFASKFTFVFQDSLSNAGAFGVEEGENIRAEWAGAAFNGKFKISPAENMQFESTLGLFMNYETPTLIDVNWETLLALKVNKYITTNFGTTLLYDHDVAITDEDGNSVNSKIQFRHVLNVGVSVNF